MRYQKLNSLALATALGVTWGSGVFILGLLGWLCGIGVEIIKLISNVYIGFSPTFSGSIIGLIIGFVDAFIGGIIIGVIYNFIVSKSTKK